MQVRYSLGRYVYCKLKAMALSSVRRRVTTVGCVCLGRSQGEIRTPLMQDFKKKIAVKAFHCSKG